MIKHPYNSPEWYRTAGYIENCLQVNKVKALIENGLQTTEETHLCFYNLKVF